MEAPSGPAWWTSGKQGHLSVWSQSLLWALIRVNDELDLEMEDAQLASFVTKVGGGHPLKASIGKWRRRIDVDPEWYPGKTSDVECEKPGPKPLMDEQSKRSIAQCAMQVKNIDKKEPSAALMKELRPVATLNPQTGEAFTDKVILEVFKTRCYDEGSSIPWSQEHPLQKTALPDFLIEWRAEWASDMLANDMPTPGWFLRHCVWVDPCYNILSVTRRQVFDIEQASYGKRKRWMSEDRKRYSRNGRSSPYGGKQKQFGDLKLWWFVVLCRGRVHIEVVGPDWQQTAAGMAEFVDRLPTVLRKMVGVGEALPRVIASDRGPGFYQSSTGHICREYAAALGNHGFRPFATEDASHQPPDVPDVLPHETAVAWIRTYLKKHPFSRTGSLDDQETAVRAMFAECTEHINASYDVEGLCRSFPRRLQALVDNGGLRLRH